MNNNTVKILMTINLESSVLVRQDGVEVLTSQKQKPIIHKPLKAKEAIQKIHMYDVAYKHFISDFCPEKRMLKHWKKMNTKERLLWHLDRMCQSVRGKSFTYEILK